MLRTKNTIARPPVGPSVAVHPQEDNDNQNNTIVGQEEVVFPFRGIRMTAAARYAPILIYEVNFVLLSLPSFWFRQAK